MRDPPTASNPDRIEGRRKNTLGRRLGYRSPSERSWEIKAFNYMEEGRERVGARFVIEINSLPFYPKLSLLRRLLIQLLLSPTEQEARYSPRYGQAQKRPGRTEHAPLFCGRGR